MVDVFGFSRGSAAARHFVSRRAALQTWPGQPTARVTIKFVGLFDTVSSYDNTPAKTGNLGRAMGHLGSQPSREFSNDVAELGLAIGGNAKRVVHLVAGDEYRLNFPSTNIQSSIAAGIGYEYTIPGAHSDIGGGYKEIETERREFYNDQERAQLVRDGWYTRAQLVDEPQYVYSKTDNMRVIHRIVGKRNVHHHYQFISLLVMVLLATKSGLGLQLAQVDENNAVFTEAQFRRYNVPADLVMLARRLKDSALGRYHPPARAAFVLGADPISVGVRNKYLHRSASSELGLGALRDETTQRVRRQRIVG